MKKGEKRSGDYTVILHSDKNCWWCGRILKAKTKTTRYYMGGYSNYICLNQDVECEAIQHDAFNAT